MIKLIEYYRKIVSFIVYKKELNISKEKIAIVYDINEETKLYFCPFLNYIYKYDRFSIAHGYDISCTHDMKYKQWVKKERLVILLYSNKNINYYQDVFNIRRSQCKTIGIPYHSKRKKDKTSLKETMPTYQNESNLIALISRPTDYINYCTPKAREKLLYTLGNWIKQRKKEYILLIKPHPKEDHSNLISWSRSLDIKEDLEQIKLVEVNTNELAEICNFAVSFYSGSCVDFAFRGKPVIELCSEESTELSKKSTAYDSKGRKISSYANQNLVFNVQTPKELVKMLDLINGNINKYSNIAKSSYERLYLQKSDSIEIIDNVFFK